MIVLKKNRLKFRFPEVHDEARCTIEFQRTLRIPDDGNDYSLPPGLGSFPLRHLDDYASRLPEAWRERGGVIAPMHQAEAMWINFESEYPFAVKVATGKICAITGDPWVDRLNQDPQDYVVLPDQPWLDGYCVEKGVIRQFVSMPLGKGYTVEEQLTGAGIHGGVQLLVYPMKAERYNREREDAVSYFYCCVPDMCDMGVAPGGRMEQEVYDDPHDLAAWDQRHSSRCFVSLLNTTQWMAVTGERPPTEPPTARQYNDLGLPWFDYYGGDAHAVAGSEKLRKLSSVTRHANATNQELVLDNETLSPSLVVKLGKARPVRESTWQGASI